MELFLVPHKACVQQQHHECCARLYFFIHAIYDESSLSLIGAFREKFTKPVVAAVYTSIYMLHLSLASKHMMSTIYGVLEKQTIK